MRGSMTAGSVKSAIFWFWHFAVQLYGKRLIVYNNKITIILYCLCLLQDDERDLLEIFLFKKNN